MRCLRRGRSGSSVSANRLPGRPSDHQDIVEDKSDVAMRRALPTAPASGYRRRPIIERAGERLRQLPAGGARALLKRAYHAALMFQTGGRGLLCELPGGEVVRALPEHRYLSWNRAEYDAFRSVVVPGTVALDIGANVGAYTLLLGHWVGGDGTVFAFEPSPAAFDGLSRHIELNGLCGVVRPLRTAVGAQEGAAPLRVDVASGESRLVGPTECAPAETRGRAPATIATPVTTIDRFCARERIQPSFVKIDVEGWELDVLRGARETIRRASALALFVELHPSIWPLIGVTREELVAELEAQSLVIEPLVPTGDVWGVEGVCVRLRRG